ncbi:MAG: right-handed parallel beta-helix repeat-containing protein [Opitutae bacterium]|nr:right-handed parallel beta-helix repeat-containing protein [Opitutae bacterium]
MNLWRTVWFLLGCVPGFAVSYYVDPAGNDSRAGTSPEQAWKTLAKVSRTTFAPGDRILFKAGGVWSGQLRPRGSGREGACIALDCYGTGARPVIHGGGIQGGAIALLNQEYWEIRNFEVTNRGATQDQYVGVKVQNSTGGPLRHLRISYCTVHDINGYASGFYGTNAGIAVVADMNNSTWHDVVIENNEVYDLSRVGIFVGPSWQVGGSPDWMKEPRSQNIVIQNNAIWNLGGDGIINFVTSHVLIQHNVVYDTGLHSHREATGPKNPTSYLNAASAAIWNVISDDTIMQFNEVYRCMAGLDGEAFDIDMGTDRTVVQYNYSHNNLGGFLLICESGSPLVDINDVKVRYNISQTDGLTKGPFHIGQYGFPPGPDKAEIHNNTVYVPAYANKEVKMWRPYGVKTIVGDAYIYNNIFYVLGKVTYPGFTGAKFDHNVFYGHHPENEPEDAHKLTSDPLLVRPGSGVYGLDSVDGYKLQAGSPALGSGVHAGRGGLGARDYWGNPVSATEPPNRGAYSGPGIAGVPPNWAFNCAVTASSASEVGGWSMARVVDGQKISFLESFGFSSAQGQGTDHTEWIALDFGAPRAVAKVILYPCTLLSAAGRGFPKHFEIQIFKDGAWVTRVTRKDPPNPGAQPQVFTWGATDVTSQVRIFCPGLDRVGSDYILQLAEIEITP